MSMIDPKGSNPLSRRKSKIEVRFARQTGEKSPEVSKAMRSNETPVDVKVALSFVK